MQRLKFALAAGALCAGGFAVHSLAEEAKAPQVERHIIDKHDLSGVQGKEVLIGTATFPPGGVVGWHTHPGDEAGYVVKGSGTLRTQGQPDRPLKAGDAFFNARGAVHGVQAGPEGATVVSSWIVDKGVPMATPVP
jgi:quercetin dioxygenase-like cupin family protein